MSKNIVASRLPDSAGESIKLIPLFGLPKTALAENGKTILLLTKLQEKGLNRDLKRSLTEGAEGKLDQVAGLVLAELPASLSETDRRLLRHWANPFARAAGFWAAMKPPKKGLLKHDAMDYSRSIDLLWLDDFAPDWRNLREEEGELSKACPVWQEIREKIEREFPVGLVKYNKDFGVFMLWPRILAELDHWSELEEQKKAAVGRVVFALSSVSLSDWFAREAVRICPDLADEYCLPSEDADETATSCAGSTDDSGSDPAMWSGLLERLDMLSDELRKAPTQKTVASLQLLAQDFGEAAHWLPVGTDSPLELLAEKLNPLMDLCKHPANPG